MELLISSVVAAVAASLLMGALMPANRSVVLRAEQAVSLQLLASELALVDQQIAADQAMQGTYAAPLDEYRWALTLTPLPAPQDTVVETTLTVTRGEGASRHVVTHRQAAPQP